MLIMTRSRRWAPEDDAQLRELFLAGLSAMRMAIRLRRTQRAVEVRIAALKLRQVRDHAAFEVAHAK